MRSAPDVLGAGRKETAKIWCVTDSISMKTFILTSLSVLGLVSASVADSSEQTNADNATRTQSGASARDGFTLRGAEVVMTLHGVTTKVDREYVLSNGAHVKADGNIVASDGSSTALRPNQLLTFDGTTHEVLLTPDGVAPLSSVSSGPTTQADPRATRRDGVTMVNGTAMITRDGVTEPIKDDVRLPNGTVAKSNGTVVMSNGNTVTLNEDQFLDLSGVLHDVRVRPAATGQRTTAPR